MGSPIMVVLLLYVENDDEFDDNYHLLIQMKEKLHRSGEYAQINQ